MFGESRDVALSSVLCLYFEAISTHACYVCGDKFLAFLGGFVVVALVLEEAVVAGRLGLGASTASMRYIR